MNLLQELIEKYGGNYSEDFKKGFTTNIGKFEYQQKRGSLEVDGTKISINLNEVGGAMPQAEPFRISLHLDTLYETRITIFPKCLWKKILTYLRPRKQELLPKQIRSEFWFEGNSDLIKLLATDEIFIKNMIGEQNYIESGASPTSRIVLTSAHGIRNMQHFEKIILVLKRIEKHVKNS